MRNSNKLQATVASLAVIGSASTILWYWRRKQKGKGKAHPLDREHQLQKDLLDWHDSPAWKVHLYCDDALAKGIARCTSGDLLAEESTDGSETDGHRLAEMTYPLESHLIDSSATFGETTHVMVEHLRVLEPEVEGLERELHMRRCTILEDVRAISSIWEELGEDPGPDDECAQAHRGNEGDVSDSAMASIRARKVAWDQRRVEAEAETEQLHAALRNFGSAPEQVESFIAEHSSVHSKSRLECRKKLRELQAELLKEEERVRAELHRLYDLTGAEIKPLEQFFNDVEESTTVDVRRQKLAEEVNRMEKYYESVRPIIDKLEELKTLVLEGARFEEMAQSTENRFKGNSTHFLSEEKFRKTFLVRYPQLRDGLIQDIECWSEQNQQVFVYRGRQLRERLMEMRKMEVDFENRPGDLTVVGRLLQVLNVPDVEVVDKRTQRSVTRQRPSSATPGSAFNSGSGVSHTAAAQQKKARAATTAVAARLDRRPSMSDSTPGAAAPAQAAPASAGSQKQVLVHPPATAPLRERTSSQSFNPPARGSPEALTTPTRPRPSLTGGRPSPGQQRWH